MKSVENVSHGVMGDKSVVANSNAGVVEYAKNILDCSAKTIDVVSLALDKNKAVIAKIKNEQYKVGDDVVSVKNNENRSQRAVQTGRLGKTGTAGISSTIQNSPSPAAWQPPAQPAGSFLEWLKDEFVTPDTTTEQLDKAKQSFTAYFERETSALANMMGPKGIDNFARDVQDKFDAIVARTFDTLPHNKDATINGKDFATAMKTAGKEAAMVLDRLKVDAARDELQANLGPVDIRPQIIAKDDKLLVIRPAPQLENLVLSGGGAKGIGYSASLDQMEKFGMLAGLENLAGSSAGALTATCLAAGLSASQFEDCTADPLFRPGILDSLKGGSDVARLYPGLKLEGGLAPAVSSLKIVDQTTTKSVQAYLATHWNTEAFQIKLEALVKSGKLTDTQLERLSQLRQLPDFNQPHEDSMITFGDLKLLHALAPEKFKLLTLTGWNKTDQREEYFNADNTPDLQIAYAARISMAFPVVFKAVSLENGSGGRAVYADGGIGSNMPAEIFTNQKSGKALEQAQASTLLLTFDANGEAYQIMHGGPPKAVPQGFFGKIETSFVNMVTRNPDIESTDLADKTKVWQAGPNALPVFHGEIGTLSMNVSDQRQHEAQMLSAWKALEQIDARTQQAYAMEYDNLDQLAKLLTDDEKRALREQPNPDTWQKQLLALLDKGQQAYRGPSQTA